MEMAPMTASVVAALRACGRRNAGTPFEMASTPVSAVAPDEKALRIANTPMAAHRRGRVGQRLDLGPHGRAPRGAADQADEHHESDRQHEPVSRDREQDTRLPRTPQVRDGHEGHEHDRELDRVRLDLREGRLDRDHTGHDRHDHGHHVVEEQRGGGHQAGELAQVVLAHDVRAAASRIGAHGLTVGAHDDRQEERDGDRDRHDVRVGVGRDQREGDQDLAGGVGHGRQGVRREDRQREDLRQERVLEPGARERSPDEHPLPDGRGFGGHRGRCYAALAVPRRTSRGSRQARPATLRQGRRGAIRPPTGSRRRAR